MMGEEHNRSTIVDPFLLEVIDELPDDGVGGCDLPVVGHGRVLREKWLWRRVRRVGLEEGQKKEERLLAALIDPSLGDGLRFATPPFQPPYHLTPNDRDVIVLEIEGA